jgi:glycosyltransferase involved in cell wall biosynthesis
MTARNPSVSVCLPVYNGERYVAEAIQSVLGQTFSDLELVISDNASTDRTGVLCREVAAGDSRVRYFCEESNRGLAWNFNRACELATGRYLVWIGHDDVMAPDYISRCVEELEKHSDVLLCFSNSHYIDGDGNVVQRVDLENTGAAATASERFQRILFDPRCDPICGVIKVEFLRQTRLHPGYADSDRVLLAELGFRGHFRKIDEYLFSRRMHCNQATATFDRWERTTIFDPRKSGKVICPWWRELYDFCGAIQRAPLSFRERLRAYKRLYWWVLIHKPFFYRDLQRSLDRPTGVTFGRRA